MCAGRLLGEGVVVEGRSSISQRRPRRLWLFVALVVVVLIQVLYALLVFTWLGHLIGYQMADRGQFGDLFGGVNALFTGLAFAGVIYTILLQSNELELQREELRLTREELHRSADAQLQQVTRLEEAAELSAISTLVNTYGTQLRPMQDATHPARVEIARQKQMLDNPGVNQQQKLQASSYIEMHQVEINIQEREWSDVIQKHQELVKRLETLVRQRTQGNGAAQKEVNSKRISNNGPY
jgi:uncharacterized membrane protein